MADNILKPKNYLRGRCRVGMGQESVDRFNEDFKPGDELEYWSVLPFGPPVVAKVRSEAFLDSSGHPVVFLEGVSGYVSVYHCKKVSP